MIGRFQKHFAIATTFAGLAWIGASMPGKATAEKPMEVAIVTSVPLTVNGTVSAQQSGVWNVGISGTANPLAVRNIDERGRIPYQCTVSVQNTNSATCPVVPAGKRLVIEHFSSRAGYRLTERPFGMYLSANPGNLPVVPSIYFPGPDPTLFASNGDYFISQPVRLYVEAGIPAVAVSIGSNPLFMAATVTGYLIDCSGQNSCAAIVP